MCKMLPVIISFANIGYLTFCENLLRNIHDKVHNHRVVFFCMDNELYTNLQKYATDRIEIVRYNSDTEGEVSSKFVNFGETDEFRKMMRIKMQIIYESVQKYSFVHFVDGDVVFCKEPTSEYYEKYKEYDIVFQRDSPPPSLPYSAWTCTGNFTLRNSERTLAYLLKIQEYQFTKNVAEQNAQCIYLNELGITDIRDYPNARLTEFPITEFTLGSGVRDKHVSLDTVMVFHANHVLGFQLKRQLLKDIGMWYIHEEDAAKTALASTPRKVIKWLRT